MPTKMKSLRHIVMAVLMAIVALPVAAEGVRGEKTLSLETGYADYNHSALAGVEFTYRFGTRFRLAPSVDYVFRHNGLDALTINLNAHIPFAVAEKVELYPLAGFCFAGWTARSEVDNSDVSTRVSRFGFNVGAGIGFRLGSRLRLGLQADYVLIKDFNGVDVMAKIGYAF